MTPVPLSVRLLLSFGLSLAFTLAAGMQLAQAEDPCAAFTWDVRNERTLFGDKPQILAGGQTLAASPTLAVDRLYQVELRPQSEVKFLEPPGKKRGNSASFAGLATITVEAAGVYRISLEQPLWIDVIANGVVVQAEAFQGRPGCNAPHKIVEFELPARVPITLQFSSGSVSTVKVAVTRSPPATS